MKPCLASFGLDDWCLIIFDRPGLLLLALAVVFAAGCVIGRARKSP